MVRLNMSNWVSHGVHFDRRAVVEFPATGGSMEVAVEVDAAQQGAESSAMLPEYSRGGDHLGTVYYIQEDKNVGVPADQACFKRGSRVGGLRAVSKPQRRL